MTYAISFLQLPAYVLCTIGLGRILVLKCVEDIVPELQREKSTFQRGQRG